MRDLGKVLEHVHGAEIEIIDVTDRRDAIFNERDR
jgi:hypothetical protein